MSRNIIRSKNRAGVVIYYPEDQLKQKSRKEESEAIDFFSAVSYAMPELAPLLFHVASERSAGPRVRSLLKQSGLLPGVSDYLLLRPRNGFPYMALELKRERKADSSVSTEQSAFLLACESEGAFACVAYGYHAAIHALNDYIGKNNK